MNIRQYGKLTLAITLFGALSSQAHANSCGDVSPLMEQMGDAYFDLDYAPDHVQPLDEDAITALFNKGNWRSGHGIRHHCFGEDAKHRTNPIEFSLESIERIETLNGYVQINAWENSDDKVASATFYVADASQWQLGVDKVYSSSQLLRRINPTTLTRNNSNAPNFPTPGGSYMIEIKTNVERSRDGLVLTQIFYVNGHMGEWFTWNLDS